MAENLVQEGDIVLCTVENIVGTTVFVKIENNGEGTIIFSEVSPGRIRNIREFVVPKKKIVCKVLRISGKNIELSLRRVTQQERKDRLEEFNQEKKYGSMLKLILGEESGRIIEKILKEKDLISFFEEAKENPENLEKFLNKENSRKILEIIKRHKTKKIIIKKQISLKTKRADGLNIIKKVLGEIKNTKVKYISGGKYSLEIESDNPKKADKELKETLENIEKIAKKEDLEFSSLEK
jgi:translation initiation factor 2 subunit 1